MNCCVLVYDVNYGVSQESPALRKAVTTHVKKYDTFFYVCLILSISCLHVTCLSRRSGWQINGIVFTVLNPRWLVGIFSDYGCQNTKKFVSFTDSDGRTFLDGEENRNTKRETESYVFNGRGNGISCAWILYVKSCAIVCFCNDLTHVFILSSSAPTHFMILSGMIDPFIFIK